MIDRLIYATELCRGKRVLDIGGQKMPACRLDDPFSKAYAKIGLAASSYRIVDVQHTPQVDYVIDLNKSESIPLLRNVIDTFQPEVILCMEILEHINCHYEVMNELARAVDLYGTIVFITLPNDGNLFLRALPCWDVRKHLLAFHKNTAKQFVRMSDLGKHTVMMAGCMQTYLWYWRVVALLSLGQPVSWGFTIKRKEQP